ncbi:MAG: hypothetical protein JWM72_1808 [Actinomycetia bacterium]|nr:hypothetical protein [Actinomycetes bacterium]
MEMRVEGVAVGPVLEEHEAVRRLDVVVHRVQQATRLQPGAVDVLETDAQKFVERVRAGLDAAGDDDHIFVSTPVSPAFQVLSGIAGHIGGTRCG